MIYRALIVHFFIGMGVLTSAFASAQVLVEEELELAADREFDELERHFELHGEDSPTSEVREEPVVLGMSPEEVPTEVPDGMTWVAGHWASPEVWESGYWRTAERDGFEWVEGGHGQDGEWIWGGWLPEEIEEDAVYQAGFVDEEDRWSDGFWRPMQRPGFTWVEGDDSSALSPFGHWVPTRFRRGHVWVPGHVGIDGWWNPGFWRPLRFTGHVWVDGHVIDGVYHHGYWLPLESQPDRVWVPGHVVGITWVPGYWRLSYRSGYVWVDPYMVGGVWSAGHWSSHGAFSSPPGAKTVVYIQGASHAGYTGGHSWRRAHTTSFAAKKAKKKAKATYFAKKKAKAAYLAKQKAKQKAAYLAKQKAKQKAAYRAKHKAKQKAALQNPRSRPRTERSIPSSTSTVQRRPLLERHRKTEVKRPRKANRKISPTRRGAARKVQRAKDVHKASGKELPRTRKVTSGGKRRSSSGERAGGDRVKRQKPAHRHGAKAGRRSSTSDRRSDRKLRISRD